MLHNSEIHEITKSGYDLTAIMQSVSQYSASQFCEYMRRVDMTDNKSDDLPRVLLSASLNQLNLTYIDGTIPREFYATCEHCESTIYTSNESIFDRSYTVIIDGKIVKLCNDCMDKVHRCDDCDKYLDNCHKIIIDGNHVVYCDDCYHDSNIVACDHCSDYTTIASMTRLTNGDDICQVCYQNDDIVIRCDDCYGYSYRDDMTHVYNGDVVCENCMTEYFYCDSCGDYYPDSQYNSNNYESLCDDCYSRSHSEYIRDYHDNPEKSFHRTMQDRLEDNRRYYGFELETECGSFQSDCVFDLYNSSNSEDDFYLMEDGSLNDGFELISQPMTLDYHLNYGWNSILEIMRDHNCNSDYDTCGLHVHVSRNQITPRTQVKIAYFVNMFQDYFEVLARRESGYYTEYKHKSLDYDSNVSDGDRYQAVNFENSATIEFRIFQSTLRIDHLYSALELCDAIVSFCQSVNDKVLLSKTQCKALFTKFIDASQYKYLPDYIKRLGLQ